MGEEPNHRTKRKPGTSETIQFSLCRSLRIRFFLNNSIIKFVDVDNGLNATEY